MRRIAVLSLSIAASACSSQPAPQARAPDVAAKSAETSPPASDRLDWWREARFGMFIHWGLYAIPAGQWGDRSDHGEWIRETAHIPLEEYEKLQPQFNPVKFNADEWARMAADAGMKYLVITSKHHDGFALFDSALTDWDVMNTPFHRDVLKELSEACARHGVRFCTYHSIMDWHHPDYLPRRSWETRSAEGADFQRFRKYLHGQVTEVITKYHPGVLWFDGEWENTWTHEYGVELYKLCRSLDSALIVNNRVDVHRGGMGGFSQSDEAVGDFGTPEQEIPATGAPGVDWETCMTMNDHWGYNSHDENWKSSRELIRMLADISSKGGNYLLNIGPRADGTFPPEAVQRLSAIGAWMKKYGEAIHGTQASPFDSFEWGRCTVKRGAKDTTLYLHVFERPANGELVLPGVANDERSIAYLAGPRVALPVERRGSDLVISVPSILPDPDDAVIAVSFEGPLVVYRAPTIESPSASFVTKLAVTIHGAEGLEVRATTDGSEPGPSSPPATQPIELTATATVKACAFHEGRAVTPVVARTFERVAPKAAVDASGAQPGLRREKFAGDWNALPDFGSLPSIETTTADAFVLPAREERVGYRYSGLIEVPQDEVYAFALVSDDGARLWVDGELVVDNDGLHSSEEKLGNVALAAGHHAIRVDWFNKTGGAELAVKFAPIGEEPRAIPAANAKHLP